MSLCPARPLFRCIAVFSFVLLCGAGVPAIAQEAGDEQAGGQPAARARAGEAAVLAALAEKTDAEFLDVPLNEAIASFEDRHGIEIEVDAQAVEEAGASIDAPVNLTVRGISLRSALNLLLREHGLTWTIEHEVLTVTSQEAASALLFTRVYPISDLLTADPQSRFDADNMIELLTALVAANTWSEVGGPGSISHVPSGLAVSQTLWAHEKIALLLDDLRRVAAGQPPHNADAATIAITSALDVKVDAVYADVPMDEVLAHLSQEHGVPILLDRVAIEQFGATADWPVSIDVHGVSLRSALELILDRQELTWIVQDEVLLATSYGCRETETTNRVYLVSDILAKGFENSYGVDDLSETIQEIIDPDSWSEVGGPGEVYAYPGALIISQLPIVHQKIEPLLSNLRELPAEDFPQQARTRLMVYTVAGADPEELSVMIRQTIDTPSWAQFGQGGEGTIQAVRALPPPVEEKPTKEPPANETQAGGDGAGTPSAELPQFLPPAMKRPASGWLLIRQSRENLHQIESLLWGMDVLQERWPSAANGIVNAWLGG